MKHGCKDWRDVIFGQSPAGDRIDTVPKNLAMGDDSPFWTPGGTGCVQNAVRRLFMKLRTLWFINICCSQFILVAHGVIYLGAF